MGLVSPSSEAEEVVVAVAFQAEGLVVLRHHLRLYLLFQYCYLFVSEKVYYPPVLAF